jgi:hypothetical protein
MIAIVLPEADERILSALCFQKYKKFKVYLASGEAEDYPSLDIRRGSWSQVEEPLLCILEPGAVPGPYFVATIALSTWLFPKYDVYHVNVEGERSFPRKTSAKKLFRLAIYEGVQAPLSSFVFRTAVLREKAVFKADGTLKVLPTVFSCIRRRPVRNVWMGKFKWEAPSSTDYLGTIRDRLDLFRWTEDYFGDDDYPLSVGDQLKFFANEVAKLPLPEEELWAQMDSFLVAQGAIRRVRAHNALKNALKV